MFGSVCGYLVVGFFESIAKRKIKIDLIGKNAKCIWKWMLEKSNLVEQEKRIENAVEKKEMQQWINKKQRVVSCLDRILVFFG